MMSEQKLDLRLEQWAQEYGWGGMPTGSSDANIIQRLIDHKGFVPSSRGFVPVPIQTAADEVEHAVKAMESKVGTPGEPNSYYRAANVLRVEYLTPKYWPESERLDRLSRIGLAMSRHTYYRAIQFARAFLMGFLSRQNVADESSSAVKECPS